MTDFDYKSYEKCLEKVLESTQKDYWAQYIDINRHQVIVGRAYLWVAAALIGAYTAGYNQFAQAFSNPIILILFLLAFSFSAVAFGICLYALPARKGYQSIHKKGWGEFSHGAYKLLSEKKDNLYVSFLTDFISKFDEAHKYGFETNQKRAKLLRLTSWLLIISFILAIIGLLTLGFIPTS
jgi:small-conductance mechanosensitive channel